ncbi:class I SAM-dependent methyltransferase [Brunnivagina elsteri]|uniref:SAM-dependent methyltransferase n=1 Tax=Brunnivagina elsteri CCALA 953 TaxID=987040 RepID=A0A2A2TA86_9CYAN|nr:class I SAM-dependent methyltransferase [Calothrix elsteri]PAX46601.1 SAM-dependent methyltransferase [Calothrix elsteri CCALA 953]
MLNYNDKSVIHSWNQNAQAWMATIENEEIESRKIVTNQAIIDAILSYSPSSILDVGCGEGWLTRELTLRGIEATGIDGVPALIESAKAKGSGNFLVLPYEDIATTSFANSRFDAVVCNFSLLGKESVDNLVSLIPNFLQNHCLLFIQTLHPVTACNQEVYVDGWRQEFWNGFNSKFPEFAPWYFRKLETWVKLLKSAGFSILECREPIHPQQQKPASILFVAQYNKI